jgi:hypothetical protein
MLLPLDKTRSFKIANFRRRMVLVAGSELSTMSGRSQIMSCLLNRLRKYVIMQIEELILIRII